MTGADPAEFRCRPLRDSARYAARAPQGGVVMHDGDAIGREMDVELEAISAGGQSGVKSTERVFRSERAAAAMREDERASGVEEDHAELHEVPES